MPRVLVTGASGFIGTAAVDAFVNAGWEVRAAARAVPPFARGDVEWRAVGDIESPQAWSGVAEGVTCIVHLAARVHILRERAADPLARFRTINVEATRRLAHEAVAAGVRRFIFLSSIGVNGQRSSGRAFTAGDTPHPELPYAVSKLEAERLLKEISRETGLEVVILRPPLVYGPDAPGNFGRLARWIERGLPLPLGNVHNTRSFISVQNLVSAIVRCAEHPAAANETFLVSDGDDVSTTDLVVKVADALGLKARLWSVPQPLLNVAARVTQPVLPLRQLVDSLAVDSGYIGRRLDWTPPLSFDEGLRLALDARGRR